MGLIAGNDLNIAALEVLRCLLQARAAGRHKVHAVNKAPMAMIQ